MGIGETGLFFTESEQNCLAELCSIISTQQYFYNEDVDLALLPDHYKQFSEKTVGKLENLFESFPNTNWGELYDKFHRQGKNR